MIVALEEATLQSADPHHGPRLEVSRKRPTGRMGRPRVEIDDNFLAFALDLRGSSGIAQVLGCSARTVRRRAVEKGLRQPGQPVYEDSIGDDGNIQHRWTSTGPVISALSNDDQALDQEVAGIIELFPRLGRTMISGVLQSRGLRVPRNRITNSYLRVHGPPARFGDRRITRRVYSVPGVNSLWHHDGQHGQRLDKSFSHNGIGD